MGYAVGKGPLDAPPAWAHPASMHGLAPLDTGAETKDAWTNSSALFLEALDEASLKDEGLL